MKAVEEHELVSNNMSEYHIEEEGKILLLSTKFYLKFK